MESKGRADSTTYNRHFEDKQLANGCVNTIDLIARHRRKIFGHVRRRFRWFRFGRLSFGARTNRFAGHRFHRHFRLNVLGQTLHR